MPKAKYSGTDKKQKYEHKNKTILTLSNGAKVIQKINDSKEEQSNPYLAEPGDKTYIVLDETNDIKQIRKFNEVSGQSTEDIDNGYSHEGSPILHSHEWIDGIRSKDAKPLTSEQIKTFEKYKNEIKEKLNIEKPYYYEINEDLARESKRMNSMFDYKENSETENYRKSVDRMYNILQDVIKESETPEGKAKAEYIFKKYSKLYADYINEGNRIDAMYPSIMIAGPSNFNARKKEKQNELRSKHYAKYDYIKSLEDELIACKYYKPRVEKQGKVVTKGYNFENKHFKVEQNVELNRLQLKFDGKPTQEIRDVLKQNGFKWSPKNEAWQRQLTPNARIATERVIKQIDNLDKK